MERGLTSRDAWTGTWVRIRSGPTARGTRIEVGRWHRIAGVDDRYGDERLVPGCRPSLLLLFPSGGGRLEVARPLLAAPSVPGPICPKCLAWQPPTEDEVLVEDPAPALGEADLDWLLDRLLDRMRVRADAKLGGRG